MDKFERIAPFILMGITATVFAIKSDAGSVTAFCISIALWFANKFLEKRLKASDLEESIFLLKKEAAEHKIRTDDLARQLESIKNVLQMKQLGR